MEIGTYNAPRNPRSMTFLSTFAAHVSERHPEWVLTLDEEGKRLALQAPESDVGGRKPRFVLGEEDGVVYFEGLWRLPVPEGSEEGIRDLILGVVRDGFENHGWQVPVVLDGGPLAGKRVTQTWEDLVGRLVFARRGGTDGGPPEAHFYKWHLRRTGEGEYLCRYERTLRGEEVDAFLRRGVESTGPFVIQYV